MPQELDENHLQLVADLAANYSERVVAGQTVSIQEYVEKLPNDASRSSFKKLANMTRFIATIENIKQENIADTAMAHEGRQIPVPSSI